MSNEEEKNKLPLLEDILKYNPAEDSVKPEPTQPEKDVATFMDENQSSYSRKRAFFSFYSKKKPQEKIQKTSRTRAVHGSLLMPNKKKTEIININTNRLQITHIDWDPANSTQETISFGPKKNKSKDLDVIEEEESMMVPGTYKNNQDIVVDNSNKIELILPSDKENIELRKLVKPFIQEIISQAKVECIGVPADIQKQQKVPSPKLSVSDTRPPVTKETEDPSQKEVLPPHLSIDASPPVIKDAEAYLQQKVPPPLLSIDDTHPPLLKEAGTPSFQNEKEKSCNYSSKKHNKNKSMNIASDDKKEKSTKTSSIKKYQKIRTEHHRRNKSEITPKEISSTREELNFRIDVKSKVMQKILSSQKSNSNEQYAIVKNGKKGKKYSVEKISIKDTKKKLIYNTISDSATIDQLNKAKTNFNRVHQITTYKKLIQNLLDQLMKSPSVNKKGRREYEIMPSLLILKEKIDFLSQDKPIKNDEEELQKTKMYLFIIDSFYLDPNLIYEENELNEKDFVDDTDFVTKPTSLTEKKKIVYRFFENYPKAKIFLNQLCKRIDFIFEKEKEWEKEKENEKCK